MDYQISDTEIKMNEFEIGKGYDLNSYPDVIGKWNQANTLMWEQYKS